MKIVLFVLLVLGAWFCVRWAQSHHAAMDPTPQKAGYYQNLNQEVRKAEDARDKANAVIREQEQSLQKGLKQADAP